LQEVSTIRRAIAEVVMIVVGVLIALTASGWQQSWMVRRSELNVLEELSTALTTDLEGLDVQMGRYGGIETRVETLLAIIRSDAPYADSVDAYFGTLYGMASPKLNTAGYESLKSQGLDLISDDRLRSQIA